MIFDIFIVNLNKLTQLDDSTFTRIISFDQAHRMRVRSGRMPVITVADDFPHEVEVKCQLVHNSQSVKTLQSKDIECNTCGTNNVRKLKNNLRKIVSFVEYNDKRGVKNIGKVLQSALH